MSSDRNETPERDRSGRPPKKPRRSQFWKLPRLLRDRLDWIAFLLFGRHVESARHTDDRTRFEGLGLDTSFETVVIRQYTLSWVVAVAVGGWSAMGIHTAMGSLDWGTLPRPPAISGLPPNWWTAILALGLGSIFGLLAKYLTRRLFGAFLGFLEKRRRARIEETLPGAVRYLHVAATGTTDPRQLFERVAGQKRVHGATAETFETACRRQALTGSMESAIRQVARDTPARNTLAPFLLTFIERSREGSSALREFLADESRLLAVEDERRHRETGTSLRVVMGLFVLLLVGPVVIGVGLVGGLVLFPEVFGSESTLEVPTVTGVVTTVGAGGILLLGAGAALSAYLLRPSGLRWAAPAPSKSLWEALRTSPMNPTNAFILLLPLGVTLLGWGVLTEVEIGSALLLAYVAVAVPTGVVDGRRARRQDRLDRELPKFVHGLAERLERGNPLRTAVAHLARERTYGPLDGPIRKLAGDLQLLQGPDGGRKRALERFVGRIGTPFAGRTMGLAVGAIEAGADAQTAVAHLQTETGRLVHADRSRRSRFPVILLVGWTVGLLIVAIVIAVNLMVLETAAPTGPIAGITLTPLEGVSRKRPLFYTLTQATMLASGWFAGLAGRGPYEGLLHSGVLVTIAWVGFHLAGLG